VDVKKSQFFFLRHFMQNAKKRVATSSEFAICNWKVPKNGIYIIFRSFTV